MSTQDSATPPPPLNQNGSTPPPPLNQNGTPPPPPPVTPLPPGALLDDDDDDDDDKAVPAGDPPKEKVDWGRKLMEHKLVVFIGLAVIVLGGLWLWSVSMTNDAGHMAPVSPVSSSEIDNITAKPIPPDAVEPTSAVEQSLDRDKRPTTEISPDTMLATVHPTDAEPSTEAAELRTPEQRENYRRQMIFAARANNTDSVTVTARDPATGQFSQKRMAHQRVPVSTGQEVGRPLGTGRYRGTRPQRTSYQQESSFSGVTPQNQNAYAAASAPRQEAPRPKYDRDGVPFETNDEINLMLAGLPESVQQQYEKMSGHRYRPLPAGTQQQSQAKDRRTEMAYVPGMDGFNTIRYRGITASPEEETAPIPDIFYRCSIQGTQRVRTGSVVVLRLTEEATFNGVTFPRNMVFSAVASVESNRVNLIIDRLGPHRVKVQTYNYAYMPGIMIDPGKRATVNSTGQSMTSALQQSSVSELSNAIAQSQQAANSWQGIAGRMGVTLLGRLPRVGEKLREVTLPDGYPMLLSKAQSERAGSIQAGGLNTPGGLTGQEGNPFQSLLMSGQGLGGYQGNTGAVPPMYYPAPANQVVR